MKYLSLLMISMLLVVSPVKAQTNQQERCTGADLVEIKAIADDYDELINGDKFDDADTAAEYATIYSLVFGWQSDLINNLDDYKPCQSRLVYILITSMQAANGAAFIGVFQFAFPNSNDPQTSIDGLVENARRSYMSYLILVP